MADRARELAIEQNAHGHSAWALRVCAQIASRTEALETAVTSYADALALASELGMRPLAAHCHAGLAKLYRRTGRTANSREQFATATSMYRDMGMTYWLEKVEREAAADP